MCARTLCGYEMLAIHMELFTTVALKSTGLRTKWLGESKNLLQVPNLVLQAINPFLPPDKILKF